MTTQPDAAPLDLRDTAKGIAVRAGILSVAALLAGTWLFSLAAKAATGLVKVMTGVLLLAIGGSAVAWKVHKVKRHLSEPKTQPALE